jgi:hypothetical protein
LVAVLVGVSAAQPPRAGASGGVWPDPAHGDTPPPGMRPAVSAELDG